MRTFSGIFVSTPSIEDMGPAMISRRNHLYTILAVKSWSFLAGYESENLNPPLIKSVSVEFRLRGSRP